MEKGNEIKTVVPALRFPEFQGMNGWEEKKLEEIGNFIGGGTPNTAIQEYWDGGIPWYTPTEIKNGDLKSSNRTITEKGLKNSSAKLLPQGAILITTRATIGDVAISKKECTTNQGFQSLVVNDSESNLFWFYWIIRHKEELIKRASGSTFKEISKNEIINITSYSPKKQEQQKIADCLSSLDDLIEATAQKVDALKEHKKGLMQRLFPAEGKNVPDLRFPEFQASEKWERKIIQDICNITTGNKNTQDKKENGIYPFFVRSPKVERIDSWSFDGEAILTAGDGVGVGKIFHYYVGKMGVHQRVYLLYDIQCNSKYLYYFFSEFFYERVKKMSAKNSVDSVRKDMISDMPLLLPSSQEQQKIADCLSSLDELIEATSQKVEILKEHKKGLMQQLFPKI